MSGSPSSITSASSPVQSPLLLTQQQLHGQSQLQQQQQQQQFSHHQTSMGSGVVGQQQINLSYSSDLSANDSNAADSKRHKNDNSKTKVSFFKLNLLITLI